MGYLKKNGLRTGIYESYIEDKLTKNQKAHKYMNKDTDKSHAGSDIYSGRRTMHEAAKRVAQKELNNVVDN
jgi:hypothetical protein